MICEEASDSSNRRWSNLMNILDRSGPFCHPQFEPSPDNLSFIQTNCKVLVIGAGGLGCELLKDLALMGFKNINVIDMDTIDLSNLNRQFLFRRRDIGQSKAEVAARFVNERVPGCKVTPHCAKIQDFDATFFSQYHIIVSGLDSIIARRWINGMLISLLEYDDEGRLDESTVIPLIDGGTEGFKGNARVIMPGMTACIDCTLDLFPPQITYPLCTIANTPRLPEHCVEYVKVLQWEKENPFNASIDGDDPTHINWIYEKAVERAAQFNIPGVTYRLVQGVVKNIIPAVASTNAVIAAACATEVFKIATSCYNPLNNYMIFNDVDGIYTYTYEAERKPDCLSCSQVPNTLHLKGNPDQIKLQEVISELCDRTEYQMKNPAVTTVADGRNRTLYMPQVRSIEIATRSNLSKTMAQLGCGQNGCEINVADATTPNTLVFRLVFDGDEDIKKTEDIDVVMG